jgi:hypothetical protein
VQVHAQNAERAEFLRQLAGRQRAVLEPLPDVRAQPVVGELADGVAQQPVLAVEVLVQGQQIQPVERIRHVSRNYSAHHAAGLRPDRPGR